MEHNSQLSSTGLKHPNMCITSTRLQTFKNWPNKDMVDIESLVNAGFFYTGKQDHVRCFHCGIGLRNWEPEDDPMVEHARWSSRCGFVREKMGEGFISAVQDAVRQVEERLGDLSLTDVLPSGRPPTTVEKKNPLLTDAAQALIEYLYVPKSVKVAVDIVLRDKGWQGLSSKNLLETIFYLEKTEGHSLGYMIQPYEKLLKRTRSTVAIYQTSDKKQKLIQENTEMKERMSCKICCEDVIAIAFLPCGHLISCSQCAPSLTNCPVCRTEVKGSFRVYF